MLAKLKHFLKTNLNYDGEGSNIKMSRGYIANGYYKPRASMKKV